MAEQQRSALLDFIHERYQVPQLVLQQIGALILMWSAFEYDLEQALWRLSGETPQGQIPSTDTMRLNDRLVRLRELGDEFGFDESHETIPLLVDITENIAAYRNALCHGVLLPAQVGGGLVLNPRWHGELRKRPSMVAHIDERLVGMMLDALYELRVAIHHIAYAEAISKEHFDIQRTRLRKARSWSGEVRYLTELMNSETY